MTDRELLEAAAKAAGIVGNYVEDHDGGYYYQGEPNGLLIVHSDGQTQVWNPLTDDGDALRLAVTLCLLHSPRVAHEIAVERFTKNSDKLTATRRAIVRAAAAMAVG